MKRWGAISSETSDDECQSLLSQFATRSAFGVFGVGIALGIGALGLAAFALAARALLVHLAIVDATFAIVGSSMATGGLIEAAQLLGWMVADKRLQRERPHTDAGARRVLSDFATPWVWAIPLLALAAVLGLDGWLIAQSADPITTLRALAGPVLTTGVAFVAGSVMLVSASWLARSPNVILAGDLETTQRANDCFKASSASRQLSSYWFLTGLTLFGTVEVWGQFSALREIFSGWLGLLAVAFVSAMVFAALALLTARETGYLGGRLTGWPWNHRAPLVEQSEQPVMEGV